MKKILVPTDFSKNAKIAADYAAYLAKAFNAEITLLHTFRYYYHEDGYFIDVEEKLLEVLDEKLQLEKNRLNEKFDYTVGRIQVNNTHGFLIDVLAGMDAKKEFDLVVMGTKGSSGVEEILIGSLTASAINRIETPILVVPEMEELKNINRVVFAADYKDMDDRDLDFLKEFAEKLNATVDVLKILDKKGEALAIQEFDEMGIAYDYALSGVKHEFHYQSHEDIEEGMNHYLKKHPAELLCVYARKHSLLEKLFHKSFTKKMAFHTNLPLLVIKEK